MNDERKIDEAFLSEMMKRGAKARKDFPDATAWVEDLRNGTLNEPLVKASERALVCCFCGKSWGYDGESPKESLLKEAYHHESICEKNPYLIRIQDLEKALSELHREVNLHCGGASMMHPRLTRAITAAKKLLETK
jgi:hypothetical protein